MTLALPKQYSSTTDQSLSSTALKPFTITIGKSTDGSPTCKTFTNKDGVLDYNVVDVPARSLFREEPFNDATGLSAILDSIEQDEYVILGVAHHATEKAQRLTSGNIIFKHKLDKMIATKKDTNNIVSRTRSCFEPANVVLFDLDGVSKDIKDVIPTLRSLHPALAAVPMIARASSSYGVHLNDTIPQAKKLSAHVYMLIELGASSDDYKLFGEILGKLCWLKGLDNHIQISTDGKMLIRQLIDVAVFSPERYSFEAPPVLKEGVTRIGKPPVIIDEGDGVPLNIATITELGLTAAEEATYSALVSEAKSAIRPEAERVSKADTELKIEQAVSAGVDREQAKRDILASKRDGHLYPSQRVRFDDNGWLSVTHLLDSPMEYDHATCADPLEPDYNGGRNIAVFYANLNINTGEFNPIIYTQAHGGKSYKLLPEPIVSSVSDEIRAKIAAILNIDIDTIHQRGLVNDAVVELAMSSSLFNPSTNKIGLMNIEHDYVVFNENDARKAIPRAFGSLYNKQVMKELITEYLDTNKSEQTPKQQETFASSLKLVVVDTVIEMLKHFNQRNQFEAVVDMFATQARIELLPNKALLVFPPRPIKYSVKDVELSVRDEIVTDYLRHFPELENLIGFIVAARFAPDRKNAFLWMHCQSDWGKNFLTDIFKKLGLVVELSVKELEKMFDGNPVGRRMEEFINAFMVVFDEVKTVKGEVKQINNRAMLSAKFESMCSVEVYTKLFLSAETIPSLAGEQGVEQQFARRFSKFYQEGALNEREVFKRYGSGLYHDVVTEVVARELNDYIKDYLVEGKAGASKSAHDILVRFHEKYGLHHFAHSLDDTVTEYATEIGDMLRGYANHVSSFACAKFADQFEWEFCDLSVINLLRSLVVIEDGKNPRIVLKSPDHFIEKYLDKRVSYSSKGSLNFKHAQIAEQIGAVGSHRLTVDGEKKQHRGCLVTPF